MKRISRDAIQRMVGGISSSSSVISGGGGGGGGVSQYWVDENYVSKEFFNRLFEIHDEEDNIIEPNDAETTVGDIQAKAGLWSEQFISALGKNDEEGGDVTLNEPLASINAAALGRPSTANVGIVWNGSIWTYGSTGIDITAMWAALAQSGTQQINASHLATALTGYATETWVGNQGYITGSALNGYATESWVGSQISDMATQTWVSGNYVTLATGQTISGHKVFEGYIDIDRTEYGSLPLGTQIPILRARSKNAETGTYGYKAVIATFGSGETGTTVNNFPVRIGSTSGATWVSAGESGNTLSSVYTDMCNTEKLLLTSDNVIEFFSGLANDSSNYESRKILTINSSGLVIPSGKTLAIGDAVLSWDSTNQGIKITKGLYSETFISALGEGSGGSGGGIDMTTVWTALGNATTEQINATHLSNALSSYATQSWVISQIPSVIDSYTKDESDGRYYAIYGGTNLNPSSTNPVNIDTLIEHGNYYCSNSSNMQYISTLPDGFGNRAFRLHVGSFWTGTKYIYQRIQGFSRTKVYERYSSASTTSWSDWYLVQDNLANYVTASELTSTLSDYALKSQIPTNNNQLINGAGYITSSGSITGNAGSATKLLTARTIWGQPFDGSADISGAISGATTISASSNVSVGGNLTVTGNVGIGTASPSYALDVVGIARAKVLQFYNRANNADAGYIGAGSAYVDYIYFQAYENNGLYIGANNGFDFVILPNHNVGVGTTEPSYKMHVNGTFYASGNSSIGGTFGVTGVTTLSSNLTVAGNVGIGTTSPTCKLDVEGVFRNCYAADPLSGAVTAKILSYKNKPYGVVFRAYSSGVHSIQVQREANDNEQFGLSLNPLGGNVGIGTISPSYKLHVEGVVYSSMGVYSAGYVTALSDIRHKEIQGEVGLTVAEIANAPAIKFLWKDKRQEGLQVGSIAQYWQKVLPEAIVEAADGELTMSYGVIALLASIKTARKVKDLERRVNLLEQENRILKEQLKVA